VLAHKERLDNLYVAFAVMLRAVVKAGDAITAAVPPAGAAMGEGRREWETRLLPGIRALGEACPTSFDETSLLEGDGEGLRREMLQARSSSTSAASRGACASDDRRVVGSDPGAVRAPRPHHAVRRLRPLQAVGHAAGARPKGKGKSHASYSDEMGGGAHHTHTYTPDHVRVRVQVHVHVHVRVSPPCAILV